MVHLFKLETLMNPSQINTETATLGGGCFWCLEAVYDELRGILSVESGYAGGAVPNPTYRQVTTGQTGHAEVIQITFDPTAISFKDILNVFFTIHDPTTLNRQGADVGTQYRSAIYYHSEEQHVIADEVIAEMENAGLWPNPIVTEVTPFDVLEHDVRAQATNERNQLRNRLAFGYRVDPAIGPVQPEQVADAQFLTSAFQLTCTHSRQCVSCSAIIAENGCRFAAGGAC